MLEPVVNFSVGADPPRFRSAHLKDATIDLKFPESFPYCVPTSATQVERAAEEGERGLEYLLFIVSG